MTIADEVIVALQVLGIPEKAVFFPRFFKTGKGEYSEGDVFLGVKVPDQRLVAKSFAGKISLENLSVLIASEYHEARLTAVFILVHLFDKAKKDVKQQEKIVDFYLHHLMYINNWDLVDSSAYKILGKFAYEQHQDGLLESLALSEEMWHKRIAVVATMHYLKNKSYGLTKKLVLQNLNHPHDLIHKANGWLLREMGKMNESELLMFLNQHYRKMPRTSLRYAIEKLDEELRQQYLKGLV